MAMQSVIPAPPSGAIRARIAGRMTPALFAETCGLAQIGPDPCGGENPTAGYRCG